MGQWSWIMGRIILIHIPVLDPFFFIVEWASRDHSFSKSSFLSISFSFFSISSSSSLSRLHHRVGSWASRQVGGVPLFAWKLTHFPSLCNSLLSLFPSLCNSLLSLFPSLCNSLLPLFPSLCNSLLPLFPSLCNSLLPLFPSLCNSLLSLVHPITQSSSKWMCSNFFRRWDERSWSFNYIRIRRFVREMKGKKIEREREREELRRKERKRKEEWKEIVPKQNESLASLE